MKEKLTPKVLLVITRLDAGGSADLTLRLAAGLAKLGHRVMLVSGPSPEAAIDIYHYAAANHFDLQIIKSLRREMHLWHDLLALLTLKRLIATFRPTVLHTNTSKAGFLGRLAGYWAHVPRIVHSDHGHIFYGYFSPTSTYFFVLMEKLASHWCHLILTLTESGKRDYQRFKIGRPAMFAVSYGGADLEPFFKVQARPVTIPSREQPLRLIWVGRIVSIKNLPLFLQAAAILQAEGFPGEYWVVGNGEERVACESLVRGLGLSNITFWGFQKDIPAFLAHSDLFVFTSLNEGFGLVIIEAMAVGLPIVGTAVGGTPDLITEGVNGYLVPSNDSAALAEAIKRLSFNTTLRKRMRENNQKKAAKYTIEYYIQRVRHYYSQS